MATEHITRLSDIDQSIMRVYIRLALCYKRGDTSLLTIAERIDIRAKSTITHLPVLAGAIRPATDATNAQEGRLELVTSLNRVNNFKAITKSVIGLPGIADYEDAVAAGMPALQLINEILAPLPDTPAPQEEVPAMAIRLNITPKGLVVALYLHHAVGDLTTLRSVMRSLSTDRPPRQLSEEILAGEAAEQSSERSQLSSSNGSGSEYAIASRMLFTYNTSTDQLMTQLSSQAPGNVTCLFSFNIGMIENLKAMVASRATNITGTAVIPITLFAILSAILWKAITAARVLRGILQISDNEAKRQTSTLITAINLRKRIDSIDQDYFGNAVLQVFANQPIHKLALPITVDRLEEAARSVAEAISTNFSVLENKLRSTIAAIHDAPDASEVGMKGMRLSSDLAIWNWSDVNMEEANLGLGLGAPGFTRQISSSVDTFVGCIVHNKREEAGSWDVTVQLPLETMQRLRADTGFMAFTRHYA